MRQRQLRVSISLRFSDDRYPGERAGNRLETKRGCVCSTRTCSRVGSASVTNETCALERAMFAPTPRDDDKRSQNAVALSNDARRFVLIRRYRKVLASARGESTKLSGVRSFFGSFQVSLFVKSDNWKSDSGFRIAALVVRSRRARIFRQVFRNFLPSAFDDITTRCIVDWRSIARIQRMNRFT